MTPSGTTRGSSGFWFWFLFMFSIFLSGLSHLVSVKVKGTALLTCNGTCNGQLTWTYYTNNENLNVLRCEQEKCTVEDSFKNRVQENIQPESLSLMMDPVLYNDEGRYEVRCDSAILCRYHLEVFVPTTMNSSVGSNVKLPCYARTEKQISDESVNILWKKDGQIVFQVQNGIPQNISSYSSRTSVSVKDYKDGDLYLTILNATTSDTGLYQCYHKLSEEHGYPGAIRLNIAGLTFSDKGTFTVEDKMGDVIAVNNVTVEGYRHFYVALFVLAGFILSCICLFLWCKCHKRSQKMTENGPYYNVKESNVDIGLPSEPAYVRVPEQETSPYISESEDRPHTPVEETMPDTKLQENTVEAESTVQALNDHSLSVPINSPEKRLDI